MWDGNKRFFWFAKNILQKPNQTNRLQKSGLIPPALVAECSVPNFYREIIAQCGADSAHKLPDMEEVLALMWRSGLTEPVLQAIWETVCPANKDQISRQEFYSCLALIALAQRNMTIGDLSAMSSLPIPTLSAVKPKETTLKGFKTRVDAGKPNGHLLKTVHPLFTEQNAKISFTDSQATPESGDLVLYSSADFNHNDGFDELHRRLQPCWEKVVDSASRLMASVKQTNSNQLLAFRTKKGNDFIYALHQIEQIVRRVHQSARLYPGTSSSLISRCDILLGIWTNLVEILEWDDLLDRPAEFEATDHVCHICGVRTNANDTHFDGDTERSFHITCANFWLNTIEQSLPF